MDNSSQIEAEAPAAARIARGLMEQCQWNQDKALRQALALTVSTDALTLEVLKLGWRQVFAVTRSGEIMRRPPAGVQNMEAVRRIFAGGLDGLYPTGGKTPRK